MIYSIDWDAVVLACVEKLVRDGRIREGYLGEVEASYNIDKKTGRMTLRLVVAQERQDA